MTTTKPVIIVVRNYDEFHDRFTLAIEDEPEIEPFDVPAMVLPHFTGEPSDPFEIVGQTFQLNELCMRFV